MSDCDHVGDILTQYIADGEPTLMLDANVRAHLQGCAECRAEAERLRAVEAALRAYPRVELPVDLTPVILREVTRATQPDREEWHPFSWEVWVPVVAFAIALLIAMISMPSRLFTAMTLQDLETTLRDWPGVAAAWLTPLKDLTRTDLFWVLWSSVFVTTAGLGLSLSLRHWNREASQRLHEWQASLTQAASHLWPWARRAH